MIQFEKLLDRIFASHRWTVHVCFWILILLLYVMLFGHQSSDYVQTFFFVGLLLPVTTATSYFLNYFLVPAYLLKERYGYFILYFIYTLIGSIFLEMLIVVLTFFLLADHKTGNMSPTSIDIFFLLTSLLMVVFLSVAIKLLLHWRSSKEDYQRLMHEKVATELKFLKTQLNPHFLFNTLNNLYYLTTEKSDQAPKAILQLSEILDYVMHAGKYAFVPIEKELRQVENYIALELLRYEDRVKISNEVTGSVADHQIPPMILITLIENAFKHGVMNIAGQSWIAFHLDCKPEKITITMKNSCKHQTEMNGIGLQNLKSQLGLTYGEGHNLMIYKGKQNEFNVQLILKAK